MKRVYRLSLFALLIFLFLGEAIGLGMFFANAMVKQKEIDMLEVQKAKIALAIVSFHSYYHAWPCSPGPLDTDADVELGGFQGAKINIQHINFYKKNNCDMDLLDNSGNALFFKPDDSIGTCSVYVNSK